MRFDTKPIAPALAFARHLCGGVIELLLHIALTDLGRGSEAGEKRMPRKLLAALAFGQIATHAGGQSRCTSPGERFLVVEAVRTNVLALVGDTTKERPMRDRAVQSRRR